MNIFLQDHWRFLVSAAALGVIGAVVVVLFAPIAPDWEVSFSLSVTRERDGGSVEYAYDGYYTIQAAESITDTVQQWLQTPEVVAAVLMSFDTNSMPNRLRDFERQFSVRKRGAQYVEVRTGLTHRDDAEQVTAAVATVLQERLDQLGLADQQGRFVIAVSDPVVARGRPPIGTSAVATALAMTALAGLWQLANPPVVATITSDHDYDRKG